MGKGWESDEALAALMGLRANTGKIAKHLGALFEAQLDRNRLEAQKQRRAYLANLDPHMKTWIREIKRRGKVADDNPVVAHLLDDLLVHLEELGFRPETIEVHDHPEAIGGNAKIVSIRK